MTGRPAGDTGTGHQMSEGTALLAWLNEAVTKAEADADRWHDAECDSHGETITDAIVLVGGATLCDCQGPTSVRRRCAADRKLLKLHGSVNHDCVVLDDDGDHDRWVEFYSYEACPVVELLAAGYGWAEGER